MKPALIIALLISLGFNIWTTLLLSKDSQANPPVASAKSSASHSAESAPQPGAITPSAASDGARTHSTAELVDILKRAGMPPRILISLARELIRVSHEEERRKIAFGDRPRARWEIGITGKLTDEQRDAMFRLDIQQEDELRALVGDDYRRQGALETVRNDSKYAFLPEDRLRQIAQLQLDNEIALADAVRGAPSRQAAQETVRAMQKLHENALQALLTPEELSTFQMYNSPAARELRQGLAGAAVTDEQYSTIYRTIQEAAPAKPNVVFDATVAAVEKHASPEAALRVVTAADGTFGPAVQLFLKSGIPPAEILRRRAQFTALFAPGDLHEQAQVLQAEIMAGLSPESKAAFPNTPAGKELKKLATPPPKG